MSLARRPLSLLGMLAMAAVACGGMPGNPFDDLDREMRRDFTSIDDADCAIRSAEAKRERKRAARLARGAA